MSTEPRPLTAEELAIIRRFAARPQSGIRFTAEEVRRLLATLDAERSRSLPASGEAQLRAALDRDRLRRAMYHAWPKHREGSFSSPPSRVPDREWFVEDPILPSDGLADAIADAYEGEPTGALAASPAPRDERLEALRAETVIREAVRRYYLPGDSDEKVTALVIGALRRHGLLGDAAALPVGDQELRDVEANPPDAVWSVTDRQYGWTAAFQAIRRAALRGAAPSPVPPDLAERFADLFMDLRLDGPAQDDWTYQQTARHYGAIFASWSVGAAVSQSDSLDVERKP